MKDIIPLEYAGQKVMTRSQLEILLECSNDQVRNVIRNHRVQFVKGVHYFELNGAEVSQYKKIGNNRLAIGRYASLLQLWTKEGVALFLQLFNTVKSRALYAELEREYFTDAPATGAVVTIGADKPQIVTIEGVRGYIDAKQVAWLNAEDVARGLGFVEIKTARVATSCDSTTATVDTCGEKSLPLLDTATATVTESCDKPYEAVRWNRVNRYLRETDCLKEEDADIKAGDYIPEYWFYLLAMKASNEAAKNFQKRIAYDILPALRKKGYYSMNENPLPPVPKAKPRPRSELAFTIG